jgi:hypothetical protein
MSRMFEEAPLLGRVLPWLGVLVVIGLCAVAGSASAASSTSCDIRKDGRKLGTTYVTSIKVTHVSCTTAKRVIKAFNACRRATGGVKGHCEKRVLGYRCTEQRGDAIPTQYSAKVSCRNSPRTIRFNYTQYT